MGDRISYSDEGFARLSQEFIEKVFRQVGGDKQSPVAFQNHIKDLVDLLPKDKEVLQTFAKGFMATASLYPNRVSPVYNLLAFLCFLEVKQKGVQVLPNELPDFVEKIGFPKPEVLRSELSLLKVLSLTDAQILSSQEKESGKTIGLVHGHFRLLTPNHLVFLILASRKCDILFVGLERGWRTEEYKGKQKLFEDEEREEIFGLALRSLPLVPFWIGNEIEYSDTGYSDLVGRFVPHFYIGQAKDPKERREAMKKRVAAFPSSRFVELPLVESLHSTQLEELIFPTS